MSFLKIDKISKSFGKTSVLKDINIEVPQGSFLVLVGPSGCGKSTLLNILAGLEASSSGEIFLAGKKIDNLGPAERNTAMVFQSYALYPNMTVEANIGFGLKMRKVKKEAIQQKVREVSKVLKIEHLLGRKPSELSGGQRQRVAMGRAIVRQPSLFLFDEPLSNLDAKLRVDMRVEIKKLHRRLNTTIVYVTHDQVEAMTLADQIAVMNLGEIQQIGAPYEIYYHPINIFTSSFMGSPSMNYLQADVEHQDGKTFLVVQDQEQKLKIPVTRPPKALPSYYGKKVVVGLRPESIFVSQQTPLFTKKVEVLEMAGAESYVLIQIGTSELMAKVDTSLNLKVGESYPFSFNFDRLVLFCPNSEKNLEYL